MIAVQNSNGELLKVLQRTKKTNYGFHTLFGLISEEAAARKIAARKLGGFEYTKNEWLCRFEMVNTNDIKAYENCSVKKHSGRMELKTPAGIFFFTKDFNSGFMATDIEQTDNNIWINKLTQNILLAMMILLPIIAIFRSEAPAVIDDEIALEKIVVTVVEPPKAVRIKDTTPDIKIKPLTKSQISKRAVKRNLGFLGMIGSKNLKDAVGGVPQNLEKATAGAGAGGDAGSGGEVLTGLGKGLRKTTVGNTGVAGLGGIGTKGAGGGKGGYGNTMVASGEGAGISSIAVSSNSMTLEGGLSRYAINATVAKYIAQVRHCYEEHGLKYNPKLAGLVTVNFAINSAGMLNHSRVKKSSLNNKKVEKCITTKMMGWQFPVPKGRVTVEANYPFMLRPVGT